MKKFLFATLLTFSSLSFAGTQWTKLKTICFEAGNSMDSEKRAMEKCQQFVQDLNRTATDSFVIQANCRAGSVDACGYGYNLKAQLDLKVLVLEDTKTCN